MNEFASPLSRILLNRALKMKKNTINSALEKNNRDDRCGNKFVKIRALSKN